ncbi:MAG: alpha-tubulin suppressor-like RCC1 family protein, partial [Kiritimatiellia bacterium]
GRNTWGQLGDRTRTQRTKPVKVLGGGVYEDVAAGRGHTCALRSDGSAWCWGYADGGRLGNGSMADRTRPVPVSGGYTWVELEVSLLGWGMCAIRDNESLWCWGKGAHYVLGNGSTDNQTKPVLVPEK